MRDSLLKTTKALTGATTVNSNSIGLGADASKNDTGSPVWFGYEVEVRYPSTPTGTSPTVKAMLQDSLDDSTFVDCALVHNTDTASALTYPILRSKRFFTRPLAKSVRVSWTLANSDNNYGTAEVILSAGDRRTQGA